MCIRHNLKVLNLSNLPASMQATKIQLWCRGVLMPPSNLSCFVCWGFLRDDVMRNMFRSYKISMLEKNLWYFKVISKCKNHFDASLKQICFKKLKQLPWEGFHEG
jgi:hypothetical protein